MATRTPDPCPEAPQQQLGLTPEAIAAIPKTKQLIIPKQTT